MPSRLQVVARRQPSQARGHARVERLLVAAEAVLAEHGYAATTMCAIAERADTAIGSLYQFFPHKEALAEALRTNYTAAATPLWTRLIRDAPGLEAPALARGFVDLMRELMRRCPAFTALTEGPRTAGSNRRRDLFRRRVARVLRARCPRLAPAAAMRYASVVQQVLRGVLALGGANADEFEAALAGYLQLRLGASE